MLESRLKKRSDLHIARKIWHVGGVLAIVIIYQLLSRVEAIYTLSAVALLGISVDFIRLRWNGLNKIILRYFGPLMREQERKEAAGTTHLLLGALLVLLIFPRPIVTLTYLFLAFGDPISSYFGILYGKDRLINQKTLQGTIAGFMCCSLIAFFFYFFHNIMTERLIIVSLLSGLVGALAELIPIGKLDDNFTFPLLSASLLFGLFHLFGGLSL